MKAIEVQEFGGPEVLKPVEVPAPTPDNGQVIVKVEAIGVNFADTLIRRGERYPGGPGPPFIPGFELSYFFPVLRMF
jgi:NADPH:quinone reductase